jgi:hypothetical protein
VRLARRHLAAGMASLLSNSMFNEEISNLSGLSWMKRTDNYFILLIAVGIWASRHRKRYKTLVSGKMNVNFELLQILVN